MQAKTSNTVAVSDPPFAAELFGNPKWSWIWLIVRLYIGYSWLSSGIGKLSNPKWQDGTIIQGFWANAVKLPTVAGARPVVAYDWYRSFLNSLLDGNHQAWFAKLVNYGEILIGLGLILGAFVGIAAFFGAFMNWNFLMAGTASTNPVLIVLSILLILAWKTAGWWGVDRWLLPKLGTPWRPKRS